jgi:hypothetical protein
MIDPSSSLRALLLVYDVTIAKRKKDDDVRVRKKASKWCPTIWV